MQAIIFVGIQASGKSSFYKECFFNTHIRINLDMLKTRHREQVLLQACIEAKQPFVMDNTHPTCADRAGVIQAAQAAGFAITGYYFQSKVKEAIIRNAARPPKERIPEKGILGTYNKLEIPRLDEGFDHLFYVQIQEGGSFVVEVWQDEV